jgi:hypothetical protein
MSSGRVGVAISTTGDEHRMGFLETCVRQWCAIEDLHSLFVTVDGDEDAARRVADAVYEHTGSVYRVGVGRPTRDGRQGVAVNKNTGLELLTDVDSLQHLFLCDDDTWPLNKHALLKHTGLADAGVPHSMVCWGTSRLLEKHANPAYATWTWPRGVLLYVRREVVLDIGGMDERFGPGGHEHVEWSRRIHQAGYTPDLYVSPLVYAERGWAGRGTRASSLWHAEDMRRQGEPVGDHQHRRRKLTSVRRKGSDWSRIEQLMVERDGDTSFVPFTAQENGRASATLCTTSTGLGAGGEK